MLVGPDNGLLSLAWEAAGGVTAAVEITSDDVIRPTHAESFRAPDTFCPATAHLARDADRALGEALDADTLTVVTLAEPEVEPGAGSAARSSTSTASERAAERPAGRPRSRRPRRRGTLRVEAVSGGRCEARQHLRRFRAGEYGVLFDPRGWLTIVRGNPASALDGLGLRSRRPSGSAGPTAAVSGSGLPSGARQESSCTGRSERPGEIRWAHARAARMTLDRR